MTCCICGKEIYGPHCNNPSPYMSTGVCCDACNMNFVIPARLDALKTIEHTTCENVNG